MSTANTISRQTSDTQLNNAASGKTPYLNVSPQSTSLGQSSPAPDQHLHHEQRRRGNKGSISLTNYFMGPRDIEKHSKLPYFLRMHGSVTPRMVFPLVFIGCWATLITCISQFWYPLVVSNVLLGVLGFVVGLSISFRTSSAYERYVEGRKYWAQLIQASRDLARHIWIHAEERHDKDAETGKADLLAKLTALNLIVAFAVALKHKLRFEPYTNYPDLEHLVSHLSTFAGSASDIDAPVSREKSSWKVAGEYLGLTFAESNPRKLIKRSNKNLGNLPLEILTYLSAYMESVMANETFRNGVHQGMAMSNLASLNEVLAGTERVLNTPLPIAYSIAISQITWVYVILLPFQLWDSLGWITIPGTIVGAYIILGIAAIGQEIENPFGHDVNDLPLDGFCKQLESEIDVIASKVPPKPEDFISTAGNRVLYSLSYGAWKAKSTEDIRATLRAKANTAAVANEPVKPIEKDEQMVV
ncbi:hypothetical protein MMC24_005207 [Lignoscripta atroalba]|nr:hypothetical protein [Lignoscripta atroalba]